MHNYTESYRARESARTVRALMACGVPMLVAIDIAAEAYELSIGQVLTSWGAL